MDEGITFKVRSICLEQTFIEKFSRIDGCDIVIVIIIVVVFVVVVVIVVIIVVVVAGKTYQSNQTSDVGSSRSGFGNVTWQYIMNIFHPIWNMGTNPWLTYVSCFIKNPLQTYFNCNFENAFRSRTFQKSIKSQTLVWPVANLMKPLWA